MELLNINAVSVFSLHSCHWQLFFSTSFFFFFFFNCAQFPDRINKQETSTMKTKSRMLSSRKRTGNECFEERFKWMPLYNHIICMFHAEIFHKVCFFTCFAYIQITVSGWHAKCRGNAEKKNKSSRKLNKHRINGKIKEKSKITKLTTATTTTTTNDIRTPHCQ